MAPGNPTRSLRGRVMDTHAIPVKLRDSGLNPLPDLRLECTRNLSLCVDGLPRAGAAGLRADGTLDPFFDLVLQPERSGFEPVHLARLQRDYAEGALLSGNFMGVVGVPVMSLVRLAFVNDPGPPVIDLEEVIARANRADQTVRLMGRFDVPNTGDWQSAVPCRRLPTSPSPPLGCRRPADAPVADGS